jgi:hypothetical protein
MCEWASDNFKTYYADKFKYTNAHVTILIPTINFHFIIYILLSPINFLYFAQAKRGITIRKTIRSPTMKRTVTRRNTMTKVDCAMTSDIAFILTFQFFFVCFASFPQVDIITKRRRERRAKKVLKKK